MSTEQAYRLSLLLLYENTLFYLQHFAYYTHNDVSEIQCYCTVQENKWSISRAILIDYFNQCGCKHGKEIVFSLS